jgi:VanZ family protein
LPGLNLSFLTPHGFFRRMGLSYSQILAYENHLQWVLHLLVAWLLVVLIDRSALFRDTNATGACLNAAAAALSLLLLAEWLQLLVGRGFDPADILFDLLGVGLAVVWLYRGQRRLAASRGLDSESNN